MGGLTFAGRRLSLVKRSFSLSGHRTSIALEPEFWTALCEIAGRQGVVLSALVASVDAERDPSRPLASSLRIIALHGHS